MISFPEPRALQEMTDAYGPGAIPRRDDPRASAALFATFHRCCPPVLIQASHCEILRDDAIRMEAKLRRGGTDVRLEMWENVPHVWQLFDGWFPEARAAIRNTARWINSLSRPTGES